MALAAPTTSGRAACSGLERNARRRAEYTRRLRVLGRHGGNYAQPKVYRTDLPRNMWGAAT